MYVAVCVEVCCSALQWALQCVIMRVECMCVFSRVYIEMFCALRVPMDVCCSVCCSVLQQPLQCVTLRVTLTNKQFRVSKCFELYVHVLMYVAVCVTECCSKGCSVLQ